MISRILKSEMSGFKRWELVWLLGACAIIIVLGIYGQDTLMGIVSAAAGTAYVILSGKGKLSAYLFGLINSVLYAIISYQAGLYGETMLNAVYYVPMQFVGFYTWSKHMNEETHEVIKRRMNALVRLLMLLFIFAGTAGYGILLNALGDTMPFIDAFTTVASVVAMLVSVRMLAEQWWLWLAIDLVTVYMWFCSYSKEQENIATLIMWMIYVVSAVMMLIKWEKEATKEKI